MEDRKELLTEIPVAGIIKKNGEKYITELDETKTKIVDRYRVGKQIGKGGFAYVYELTSIRTGKKYAGKVVEKAGLTKPKYLEKFMSEIRIHQSLDHPHICKMYKHFEDNRYHYLILELCSNETLAHLLRVRKCLTEPEVQYFLLQIIDAVSYLHKRCIIHRDLKLGNIFLDENLEVKVGDLGLAAQLNEPNERKKTMCGTPNYIAPEILQSNDKRAYSYEVDIWAIGVITYTMLIGKAPFDGGSKEITYRKIRENELSFPIKDHHISHQARMFIRSILNPDPTQRLTLEQMVQHPFFTDSPIDPPKSLPLYILREPFLLSARLPTEPTPVLQRAQRLPAEDTGVGEAKRIRMADLPAPRLPVPSPAPSPAVGQATGQAAGQAVGATGQAVGTEESHNTQTGEVGGNAYTAHLFRPQAAEYDLDGNGRNNLNRFSLTGDRAREMEGRLDYVNRSFHDARGLLPSEVFEGLPTGIVPSITVPRGRFEEKEGSPLLQAHAANLYTAMNNPGLMVQANHVQVTRTANWIVDEYDFTRKYGIGYMFSNGNIGILFNDKTSIVLSADGMFFEYHPRISITQWNAKQTFPPSVSGSIDDYPDELAKKITLIKYFRTNFRDRAENRMLSKEEVEDTARGGPKVNMPFALKWLKKEDASICMLSTGAIQVRYDGGTILNLESPFDDVTYLDKYGVVTAMPLAKAISLKRDDLMRRLDYVESNIQDIVTHLSKAHH